MSRCHIDGVTLYLGTFRSPTDAARMHDRMTLHLRETRGEHGRFALNYPTTDYDHDELLEECRRRGMDANTFARYCRQAAVCQRTGNRTRRDFGRVVRGASADT